jgi:hypothetical protein
MDELRIERQHVVGSDGRDLGRVRVQVRVHRCRPPLCEECGVLLVRRAEQRMGGQGATAALLVRRG